MKTWIWIIVGVVAIVAVFLGYRWYQKKKAETAQGQRVFTGERRKTMPMTKLSGEAVMGAVRNALNQQAAQ